MQLQQFVPSEVCLQCEGCCRFPSADSPWRPKVGSQEPLADQVDTSGHLPTKFVGECYHCKYFKAADSTCQAYGHRPFECELYPFILSLEQNQARVYMHLACPYIQMQQDKPALQEYITYLKGFLSTDHFHTFLAANRRLLHDYSAFHQELMFLFDLPGVPA